MYDISSTKNNSKWCTLRVIHTENSQWAHLIASLGEFWRYVRFTEGLNSKPFKLFQSQNFNLWHSSEWAKFCAAKFIYRSCHLQYTGFLINSSSPKFTIWKKRNKNADVFICFCKIPLKDCTFHVADQFSTKFHIFTFQFQERQTEMPFTQ
jgi:hypothetical protein